VQNADNKTNGQNAGGWRNRAEEARAISADIRNPRMQEDHEGAGGFLRIERSFGHPSCSEIAGSPSGLRWCAPVDRPAISPDDVQGPGLRFHRCL